MDFRLQLAFNNSYAERLLQNSGLILAERGVLCTQSWFTLVAS